MVHHTYEFVNHSCINPVYVCDFLYPIEPTVGGTLSSTNSSLPTKYSLWRAALTLYESTPIRILLTLSYSYETHSTGTFYACRLLTSVKTSQMVFVIIIHLLFTKGQKNTITFAKTQMTY